MRAERRFLREKTLERARVLAAAATQHEEDLKFFQAQREGVVAAQTVGLERSVEEMRMRCNVAQSRLNQVTTPTPTPFFPHRPSPTPDIVDAKTAHSITDSWRIGHNA